MKNPFSALLNSFLNELLKLIQITPSVSLEQTIECVIFLIYATEKQLMVFKYKYITVI